MVAMRWAPSGDAGSDARPTDLRMTTTLRLVPVQA